MSGYISENITRGVSAIREYDVRDYDAETTHKDYLIGDDTVGASRRLDVPYLVTKAPGAALGLSFTLCVSAGTEPRKEAAFVSRS